VIGVSLSSEKRKGGMGVNIGLGFLLSFTYILFNSLTSTIALTSSLSPAIAVWVPNIIFAAIAVYLYNKAPK
ncbi:MAG: LptF/LptG family permease, partial [Prevotellaceae bacterium]|nr:LptF/LptG family permease [Prevotellaceae bacterium]